MHRRVHVITLLVLSLLGSGVQWDLVQVVAWGRMIADHSRSMSLEAAVTKTFNGEMCQLCRIVARAKQQNQRHSNVPEVRTESKLILLCQSPAAILVRGPRLIGERPAHVRLLSALPAAPPVPPPRAA